jgi:hypothetical protein
MKALTQKFDEARMVFDRLSGREKVLVAAVFSGIAVAAIMFISLAISVSLSSQKDLVATQRSNYEQILGLKARFEQARKNLSKTQEGIDARNVTEANKIIGNLAETYGLAVKQINQSKGGIDKKAGIREVSWKVDFSRATLGSVLHFMEGLEKTSTYFVRNINMKRRYDNKSEIDVSLNISALVPMEDEG